MNEALASEMRKHLTEPFPDGIEKGLEYGEVDPVMIDADIFGWASRAGSLSVVDRQRLAQAMQELERSLKAFPIEARSYYERLVRIARLSLTA